MVWPGDFVIRGLAMCEPTSSLSPLNTISPSLQEHAGPSFVPAANSVTLVCYVGGVVLHLSLIDQDLPSSPTRRQSESRSSNSLFRMSEFANGVCSSWILVKRSNVRLKASTPCSIPVPPSKAGPASFIVPSIPSVVFPSLPPPLVSCFGRLWSLLATDFIRARPQHERSTHRQPSQHETRPGSTPPMGLTRSS